MACRFVTYYWWRFIGNTKRIITDAQTLYIDWNSWKCPEIFKLIQSKGNVPIDDMRQSFNMGIGMVLIIKRNHIDKAKSFLNSINEKHYIIGKVE